MELDQKWGEMSRMMKTEIVLRGGGITKGKRGTMYLDSGFAAGQVRTCPLRDLHLCNANLTILYDLHIQTISIFYPHFVLPTGPSNLSRPERTGRCGGGGC